MMWRYVQATMLAGIVLGAEFARADAGDLVVRVAVEGSDITVRTCSKFAGAVCSITFRGKEYIDTKDHGRLLQSASSFDGYGECLNPTEGGATHDTRASSSVLKWARAENNQIRTRTDMAYWLRPGQEYRRGCGTRKEFMRAVNTTSLSGHLLEKSVSVGLPGFPNVIEHRAVYFVPAEFQRGIFEASTGYMPKEFSLALYFDPLQDTELDPGDRHGEQSLPVILATPDRRHAMGVYSPDLPRNGLGYGRFSFPDVVKWNCVFREQRVKRGQYEFRCLIALGSVAEVKSALRRLHIHR